MGDVLERFGPATAAWFRSSFTAPTPAQAGAWQAIASRRHTLVVAPTGSGKTLAAFLWALDRLSTEPTPDALRRCRVVYVSPLKALAVDVERNLTSPLVGIRHAATRLGLEAPEVRVAVRSGDTAADERRRFAKHGADVLITTPESLYLLLTSSARTALAGVETVIVDEIHAVAGTKRGAHLAVTLERLDALLERPAQRVGLSATVRPIEEVARFLAGGRPVETVAPPADKRWQLDVVVGVPDMGTLGEPTGETNPGDPRRTSVWPHIEERIVDQIAAHRSTLVFANSRRQAERLTSRLNELWEERAAEGHTLQTARQRAVTATRPTSSYVGNVDISQGAPALLAKAHHGSVSREQRKVTEEELKAGLLPAVVATSSLELGIDMGAVDLVIQVESPPSVASGLQRVGRAGHQVGAVSHGIFYPKYRGDLVQTAVVVDRMRAGAIEALHIPANPLDVLSQQVVAMVAMDEWTVADVFALVRRAAPYATLTMPVFESVLDMLAGRYPSEEFAELRPRLVWDRLAGTLTGRAGAQRLAVTSGGTIPDRGLFRVFLASSDGPGRRVGELDEEMVYESRVGDVITLGTSTWQIEDITHDQVLVTPAPGQPGRLPFWKGDGIGRPAELGAALGAFVREVAALGPRAARDRTRANGLDEWAADNLASYLTEQREAVGRVSTDRQLVIERFRDELGDWRIVLHSPFGSQVHAPWALALGGRLREAFGVDVSVMHADDGIVLRIPETDRDITDADLLDFVVLDPDEVHDTVVAELGGSALFAARFRECAGRALLLPRRRPDQRQALWQQRQRASALLQVASQYPSFPIVLETVRECVQDVFDVPALIALMRAIRSREVSVASVQTPTPSPFAKSLMFGYVAQYLYEGDSPLAERRAAALALDPALLAELLGTGEGLALRDLLDPRALTDTEAELQHLTETRRARDADQITDLLRTLGPLSAAAVARRSQIDAATALASLAADRRVISVRLAEQDVWAAVEDAGRLRDALGVALPQGLPAVFTEPVADPLGDLVVRYARTHVPFTVGELASWLGLGTAVVHTITSRLVADGRLVSGALRPVGWASDVAVTPMLLADHDAPDLATDLCDPAVLRLLRRRSLAALRREVEPVAQSDFARFLPAWQGVGSLRGADGVLRAIEQLAGVRLPASALESLVLPARVVGYTPGMLDELMVAGEVLWQGHGELAGNDGWVSLHPAEAAAVTLAEPQVPSGDETTAALLAAFELGGGLFYRQVLTDPAAEAAVTEALWQLVWSGWLTNDTLAPLRARLAGGRTAHKPRVARSRHFARVAGRRPLGTRPIGGPIVAGRWSALPRPDADSTTRAYTRAEILLDRYGVVTRGSVAAEETPGGFAGVYQVLAAAEEAGRVGRGYFVEGLGAAQFGTTGAVDRLRSLVRPLDAAPDGDALVLAACDPANPYGAALGWPSRGGGTGHQPARKAGALVILLGGELVLYVERGGRTLLSWSEDPDRLVPAARGLAEAVHHGALGKLTVEKIDGGAALGSSHPLAAALEAAGFHLTPRGLRLRR